MSLTRNEIVHMQFLITQTAQVLGEYLTFACNGNSKLQELRVKNIRQHIDSLVKLRDELTDKSEQTVEKLFEAILDTLNRAGLKNCDLSRDNKKIHQSYNQNRSLGQNPFTAWVKKTFFQSRAQLQIEKARDLIVTAQADYNKSLEQEGSPSSAPTNTM